MRQPLIGHFDFHLTGSEMALAADWPATVDIRTTKLYRTLAIFKNETAQHVIILILLF